jgi:hypothetical protein
VKVLDKDIEAALSSLGMIIPWHARHIIFRTRPFRPFGVFGGSNIGMFGSCLAERLDQFFYPIALGAASKASLSRLAAS